MYLHEEVIQSKCRESVCRTGVANIDQICRVSMERPEQHCRRAQSKGRKTIGEIVILGFADCVVFRARCLSLALAGVDLKWHISNH